MRQLIKHLKPFAWMIAIIFVLLFAQAMSDLSLPSYMSRIVNIGIQQGGIENSVPTVIRASELNKAMVLMTADEKTQVMANFVLLDRSSLSETDYTSYLKSYPILATTPLYKLNTADKTQIDTLDTVFKRYVPAVSIIEKNGNTILSGSGVQVPAGTDPFAVISSLSPSQLDSLRGAINGQLTSLPMGTRQQFSVSYLSNEYKTVGVNTLNLQTFYILSVGLIMLLLTLASVACAVMVGYLSALVAAGVGRNLRWELFARVESFSSTEFDRFSTASLITRSTNDITQIQLLGVMIFRVLFYAPLMGIGGIIKVVGADTSMLWIIGTAVGGMLTMMVITFAIALPRFTNVQKLVDKLNLVTREILTGLMVIRAFNRQAYEENKFDAVNNDLTATSLFVNRIMVFMQPVMMLVMNGVILLIVWVGSHQVDIGAMQVGDMMAFMQYAMQIIFSFLMVSFMFIMVPRASVSADRISEVLETEPIIRDPQNPRKFDGKLKGEVQFQDVSFRFPGAEDNVLKHITFTARPGQTTAFIGSTGSGKTTLINLIPRFYDVTSGRVLVDGIDVREVTQHDLRDKIGYVSQKAVLFSGTIGSNIRYANENATDADLANYVETAQATDFITTNEQGYAAVVSQGGTNLSGGQKQRLAIARALAKRPEIFIFDDSLSALDFKTDATLRRALKKETADATVLIVTQRVSTIMGADQIVVLEKGEIVGIGTHRELMEKSEVYREIAKSQLSREELVL